MNRTVKCSKIKKKKEKNNQSKLYKHEMIYPLQKKLNNNIKIKKITLSYHLYYLFFFTF